MGKTKMEYKCTDVLPVCPHCNEEIKEIGYVEQAGVIAMKVVRVFICPHCRKVLGTGMVGF